jgi:pimeloyl-ACP methyl ester carboxylesterase
VLGLVLEAPHVFVEPVRIESIAGPAEALVLPGSGHSPHRDHPQQVLDATVRFLRRLTSLRRLH